jgi:hypothetical protein
MTMVGKYKLTNKRQPGHPLQSTRYTAQEGEDCADNAKHKRTSAVAGDCVHGDSERQNMTPHDEYGEKNLGDTHEMASK